jgi:hypothetical protein
MSLVEMLEPGYSEAEEGARYGRNVAQLEGRSVSLGQFWGAINPVKVRLFCDLVLRSAATFEKADDLDSLSLWNILDDLHNAMDDPQALSDLRSANRTDDAVWEFNRFLSLLASTQIAEQEIDVHLRTGRLLAMFEALPSLHAESMQPQSFEETLAGIPAALGATIRDLTQVFFFVFNFYAHSYRQLRVNLPFIPSGDTQPETRRRSLERLLAGLSLLAEDESLLLTPRRVEELSQGAIERSSCLSFCSLLGKSPEGHRRLQAEDPAFQLGHPATSLVTLDRYPLVLFPEKRQGDPSFVVPNVRLFIKGFPRAVDFVLQRHLGDCYNQVRGASQEIYLRCLVEDRLPSVLVVPERVYGKEHQRGPDATLINPHGGELVLVESKGRRIAARTRHLLYKDLLHENLAPAYQALLKLPKKIEALYSGLKEYADVQDAINATREKEPILVVVLDDDVYFMSELVRLEMDRRGHSHPLHGFSYRFAVVSLNTFERAVQLAAEAEKSLWELFREHWDVSGRNLSPPYDHNSPTADMFGGVAFDERRSFGASFLRA